MGSFSKMYCDVMLIFNLPPRILYAHNYNTLLLLQKWTQRKATVFNCITLYVKLCLHLPQLKSLEKWSYVMCLKKTSPLLQLFSLLNLRTFHLKHDHAPHETLIFVQVTIDFTFHTYCFIWCLLVKEHIWWELWRLMINSRTSPKYNQVHLHPSVRFHLEIGCSSDS